MSNHTSEKQGEENSFKLTFSTLGCVKWFNKRSGYGFVVAIGDQSHYGDVFVHHSQLRISDPNVYKTLITGEYVQFEITPSSSGKHKYQANNVTGVYGGKLLCENSPVARVPRSTTQSVESRNIEEVATQPKYRILQRPSSVPSPSPSPRPSPIPTSHSSSVIEPIPLPQDSSPSLHPPTAATELSLPKSRKPRKPKSKPHDPPSDVSPPVGNETPYKNAFKRTPRKEA
jgi:cold shock CspA family protein